MIKIQNIKDVLQVEQRDLEIRNNIVTSGLNVKELMDSIEKRIAEGLITEETIIAIDTFDGYRHGIEKLVMEHEVLMISSKMHQEC